MVDLIRFNVAREITPKDGGGVFDVQDTFCELVFRAMPTMFSFDVLFSVIGMDCLKENLLEYYLVDPTGVEILAIDSIKVAPAPMMQQNDSQSWNCVINAKNVEFNHEGVYKHIVICNDEEVCQIPMVVKKALIS